MRALATNAAQSAGLQTVEWNGRADDGRVVAVEGDYRVQVTATDPANGHSVTTIGNVTVMK
jgi:hypothetical protein